MLTSRLKRCLVGAIVAVVMIATIVVPSRLYADTVLDYEPTETINPVADNITRLNVSKLEKGARDHVKGAHLAIYEKETGRLVTEWVSDGSAHEVARNANEEKNTGYLNIDTVYILKELSAPEGYALADDVEFVIHSDNFNTTGEILSGDENGNAEADEIRGTGSEQAFVINLYDEATLHLTEEQKVTRQKEREEEDKRERQREKTETSTTKKTTTTVSGTSSEGLTKTSDSTSYVPAIVVVVLGTALIGFGIWRRKR